MKTRKISMYVLIMATVLFSWVSVAGAWTYSVVNYSYEGRPALTGTIPGVTYYAKVAAITNDSSSVETLYADLYYSSSWVGNYQWSPNYGDSWINIDDTTDTWTKTVGKGKTVWLRNVLRNDAGSIFHILSPSPWGEADSSYDEDYYFAFPPSAHYYAAGWVRDIDGFVAVMQSSD